MGRLGLLIAIAALLFAAPAPAHDLPPSLADLMREANPQERETIENVAKRLYVSQRENIDRLVDDIKDEEKAQVAEARFVQGWSGEVSLGASWSSGNTDEWSVSTSASIERKGPQWEHDFKASFDLRETDAVRTEERWSGSYRARRDFLKSPWFTFGQVSYEHDGPQGIRHRYTEAVGGGYQLFDTDDFDWEVSLGPALRQTSFASGVQENRLAAFLSTDLKWEITDTMTLNQQGQLVLDESNTTFNTKTSLSNNLYGRLSARLSFELQYEANPSDGREKLDKYSKFSLVLDM